MTSPTVQGCRARRARNLALMCAAAVLLGTALSGCGTSIVQRNTFTSEPRPAIADDAVAPALKHLDEVRNEANTTRNPELIQTVEADPLLAITTAVYALEATTDPEATATPEPITRGTPTVFVPRFTEYPQWFVVASPWREGEPTRLEVLTRDASADAWTSLIAPEMLAQVDFPALSLDDAGYVVPATKDFLAGLAIPASGLAASYATALTTGKADGSMSALLADGWSQSRRAADAAAAKTVGAAAAVVGTYAAGTTLTQALRTQDGGALVFFTIGESLDYTVNSGYFLKLDDVTAKIVGTEQVTGSLTETSTAQLAVYVPPAASGDARVVAARWDRTGLTAAEPASATPSATPTS